MKKLLAALLMLALSTNVAAGLWQRDYNGQLEKVYFTNCDRVPTEPDYRLLSIIKVGNAFYKRNWAYTTGSAEAVYLPLTITPEITYGFSQFKITGMYTEDDATDAPKTVVEWNDNLTAAEEEEEDRIKADGLLRQKLNEAFRDKNINCQDIPATMDTGTLQNCLFFGVDPTEKIDEETLATLRAHRSEYEDAVAPCRAAKTAVDDALAEEDESDDPTTTEALPKAKKDLRTALLAAHKKLKEMPGDRSELRELLEELRAVDAEFYSKNDVINVYKTNYPATIYYKDLLKFQHYGYLQLKQRLAMVTKELAQPKPDGDRDDGSASDEEEEKETDASGTRKAELEQLKAKLTEELKEADERLDKAYPSITTKSGKKLTYADAVEKLKVLQGKGGKKRLETMRDDRIAELTKKLTTVTETLTKHDASKPSHDIDEWQDEKNRLLRKLAFITPKTSARATVKAAAQRLEEQAAHLRFKAGKTREAIAELKNTADLVNEAVGQLYALEYNVQKISDSLQDKVIYRRKSKYVHLTDKQIEKLTATLAELRKQQDKLNEALLKVATETAPSSVHYGTPRFFSVKADIDESSTDVTALKKLVTEYIENKTKKTEDRANKLENYALQMTSWSVKKVVVANVATYLAATMLQNMLEGYVGTDVEGTDTRTPKQKIGDALVALVSLKKHKAHFVELYRTFKPAPAADGEKTPGFSTRLKTFGKSKPFFAAGCTALLVGNTYVAATSIPARTLYRKILKQTQENPPYEYNYKTGTDNYDDAFPE